MPNTPRVPHGVAHGPAIAAKTPAQQTETLGLDAVVALAMFKGHADVVTRGEVQAHAHQISADHQHGAADAVEADDIPGASLLGVDDAVQHGCLPVERVRLPAGQVGPQPLQLGVVGPRAPAAPRVEVIVARGARAPGDGLVAAALAAAALGFLLAVARGQGDVEVRVLAQPGVGLVGLAHAAARCQDADLVCVRRGGQGQHRLDHFSRRELVHVRVEPEQVGFVPQGHGLQVVAQLGEDGAALVLGNFVAVVAVAAAI